MAVKPAQVKRRRAGSILPEAESVPESAYRLAGPARSIVRYLLKRIRWGTVSLLDGADEEHFCSGEPSVRISVHDRRAFEAILRHGSVGLGQSYIDDWWDCDDIASLVRIIVHNRSALDRARDRLGRLTSLMSDPLRRLQRSTPERDRKHVRAHYDIGNDFFALMLDSTMSYSCAIFEEQDASLEQASTAKLDKMCRKLRLRPSDHVVEIGTGWGAFAVHAASHYGCRVTTTTTSDEQFSYARLRVAEAGLSDRIKVLNEDYRDLTGRYDKLVSIEMIEAVDWRDLDLYFRVCARLLAPDGLMGLQAITIADGSYDRAKNDRDFTKTFIFPGGCLPSIGSITASSSRAGFSIIDLEDIGRHYAETLRRWDSNVRSREADVRALGLDERFLRMWHFYLTYCEGAFLERHISDVQVLLAGRRWRPPLAVRS